VTAAAPLPLVLVVVGTDHHPFDRLVGWVDAWAATGPQARVLIQYGTSSPPRVAEGAPLLPVNELQGSFREATVVVCHGGPGSIMGAREAGLVPIVVPRRSDLGEHVDDHQVRFSGRVAQAGQVHLATDESALISLVERALHGGGGFRFDLAGEDPAADAVARFGTLVQGLVDRKRNAHGGQVRRNAR
jgi:UDP-N-acetylglucosamine transferase subunit ALG13